MSPLMGDWACKPVEVRGIYALVQSGDLAALKERERKYRRLAAQAVHENAELSRDNDALRQRCRELEWELGKRGHTEDIEWMNLE